jgi:hypothetical protein
MTCRAYDRLEGDIFALEARQFTAAEMCRASEQLDSLLDWLSERHFERYGGPEQVRLLSISLFREEGYRFRTADRGRGCSTAGTLLDRGGNCLGLTTLYVLAANFLNLPVRPVLYEGHIAAACIDSDGCTLPIEVSRGGGVLQGRIADRMYSGYGDGRVLTDEELVAVHMSNQAAFVWVPRMDFRTALDLLSRSTELFPEYVGGWINLAALHIRCYESALAARALERVFELSPQGKYLHHAITLLESVVRGQIPREHHVT